jgi:penicillin-binding protein 2
MTETKTKVRLTVLGAILLFLFASLSTRLWFLQVLATEEFAARAQSNRVRILPEPAPRGRILDRDGNVLVENRTSRIILVDRSRLGAGRRERVVARLAELLGERVADLERRLESPRYYAYQPVPIAFDIPEPAVLYIVEHPRQFPGVTVDTGGVREYPYKTVAAHLLGYTGEISPEQLELARFEDYRPGTLIGKAGVELEYESFLQGIEGRVNYEVDARGQIVGRLGVREPVPGGDLVLTLDLDAQRIAERSLEQGIALARGTYDKETGRFLNAGGGAAVVMDPRNGRILAMASYPDFSPATFIGGARYRDLKRLTSKKANSPLLNRAVQSSYPPGSTFKPFVALAALKQRIADLGSYYPCPSEYSVENDPSGVVFHNWKSTDSGSLNVAEALVQSCDTVFYDFGYRFYTQRIVHGEPFQRRLRELGLGRRTGIDQPSEEEGRIPDVQWLKEGFEAKDPRFLPPYRPCREGSYCWVPGDDINMSIGQGNVLVSPLQLATAYSAIANGGTLYAPRLGLRIQEPGGDVVRAIEPQVVGKLPYRPEFIRYVRDSLAGVVRSSSGTAALAFAGYPHDAFPLAGKTGTAEMPPRQDFSWFAAMSLVPDKPYVVVAMVEEGGHGSTVAAPVVRRIYEGLFGIETSGDLSSGGDTD